MNSRLKVEMVHIVSRLTRPTTRTFLSLQCDWLTRRTGTTHWLKMYHCKRRLSYFRVGETFLNSVTPPPRLVNIYKQLLRPYGRIIKCLHKNFCNYSIDANFDLLICIKRKLFKSTQRYVNMMVLFEPCVPYHWQIRSKHHLLFLLYPF